MKYIFPNLCQGKKTYEAMVESR
jgi:hypothetical protein